MGKHPNTHHDCRLFSCNDRGASTVKSKSLNSENCVSGVYLPHFLKMCDKVTFIKYLYYALTFVVWYKTNKQTNKQKMNKQNQTKIYPASAPGGGDTFNLIFGRYARHEALN